MLVDSVACFDRPYWSHQSGIPAHVNYIFNATKNEKYGSPLFLLSST